MKFKLNILSSFLLIMACSCTKIEVKQGQIYSIKVKNEYSIVKILTVDADTFHFGLVKNRVTNSVRPVAVDSIYQLQKNFSMRIWTDLFEELYNPKLIERQNVSEDELMEAFGEDYNQSILENSK